MFPLREGVFGSLKVSARERLRRCEELIDFKVGTRSGEDSSRERERERR